ncbi:MAG TPA: hypothetical protein VM662_08540 [Sphingomonas sp.]|nr:hypothetical protein [Sphingomonas sp.]
MSIESNSAVQASGWTMLPRPNRRLTALAAEAARCARALLPDDAGLFLGLETDAEGTVRLLWWRRGDFKLIAQITASPEGFCPEDSDEGALQEAAAALLDYLAGRWPTPPADYGVITDGVGVAFAPNHPAPSAEGWLLRQASSASALLAILPLDPNGPCALLSGTGRQPILH